MKKKLLNKRVKYYKQLLKTFDVPELFIEYPELLFEQSEPTAEDIHWAEEAREDYKHKLNLNENS